MQIAEDVLIKNIREEKSLQGSHDRYAVRFVFLPLYRETTGYILSMSSQMGLLLKRISDYFPSDKWITWERLFARIESDIQNSDNDILFIGLSEYLRFSDSRETESAFLNLIGLESNGKNRVSRRRAYFVMDSFETVLNKVIQDNHHRNVFYNPIISGTSGIQPSGSKGPQLIISAEMKNSDESLKTVHEYLDILAMTDTKKVSFDNPIKCSSTTIAKLAAHHDLYLEDNLFPYVLIGDGSSLISLKVPDFPNIEKFKEDKPFLKWLGEDIDYGADPIGFEEFCKKKLGFDNLSFEDILKNYLLLKTIEEKKLTRVIIEEKGKTYHDFGYLNYLLESNPHCGDSQESFIRQIYLSCSETVVQNSFFNERLALLYHFASLKEKGILEAPEELVAIFSSELEKRAKKFFPFQGNFDFSVRENIGPVLSTYTSSEKKDLIFLEYNNDFVQKVLTNCSDLEKRLIIVFAANGVLSQEQVQALYPELFGYLFYKTDAKKRSSSLDDYFYEYRESKICGQPTDSFKEMINRIDSRNFLDVYNDSNYENVNNKVGASKIYVLDGVGAEYLPLLSYLFEKKNGIKLTSVEERKALLPTITSINRQLIDTLKPTPKWYQEFDAQIIHGEFYSTPRNLQKAISLLDELVGRVVRETAGASFLVIADHGCTAAHKILGLSKKYDAFSKAEHDGRCCEVLPGMHIDKSSDYICYTDLNSKDWIIPVNAISLYKTSRYEAHGGGTLEEIFVPYIYYAGESSEKSYQITIIKKTVSGLDHTIKFSLNEHVSPEEVEIIEETGNISKPDYANGVFTANLKVARRQTITVKIGSFEGKIEVVSNSGITNNSGGFF